jgi:hypothetical protein
VGVLDYRTILLYCLVDKLFFIGISENRIIGPVHSCDHSDIGNKATILRTIGLNLLTKKLTVVQWTTVMVADSLEGQYMRTVCSHIFAVHYIPPPPPLIILFLN